MSPLSIKNLTAGYDAFQVLESVNLEVEPGEMVVLIGPNGAGKSTVLKSVFGLTTKTGGSILFRDRDITKLPTHSLIDHKETMRANLEKVYTTFPALREKRRAQAGTLYGGQQQQLAIGRSLMMSPELLMLDEPSLGLSPKLMHEVFVTLENLRQSGTTILVVEQNVRLAL